MTAIVTLNADHADQMAELHKTGFSDPWSAKSFESLLQTDQTFGFGIFEDETLIAFVVLTPAVDDLELSTIVTRPEYRGKGLATRLLAHCIAHTKSAGFERLLLEVAKDNHDALHLYRKSGFTEDGIRPRYYRRPNSERVDAILMSLRPE